MTKYVSQERFLEVLNTVNDNVVNDIHFCILYDEFGKTIFIAELGYITYYVKEPTLSFIKDVVNCFGGYEITFVNVNLI